MPYAIALTILSLLVIYFIVEKFNREVQSIDEIPYIDKHPNEMDNIDIEESSYYLGKKKINWKRKHIKSLDKSYVRILKAYEYIDRDVRNKKEVVPAAEWLLDNLYLIEKEYKDIKHNMPNSYYRHLPLIDKGRMKGFPRIYSIALDIVARTDGKVEESNVEEYIAQYQNTATLTSGELWALPIMLRISLIQNIGRVIEKMIFAQKEKNKADKVADRLINAISDKKLNNELVKIGEEYTTFTTHFIERLLKILRDNGIENAEIYKWIDDKLEIQDFSSEKMINLEHQKQAGFQLSMRNCISGIREVESFNWRNCFEKLSNVEKTLMRDPCHVYEQMDFESRDYYRHEIEKLAKHMNMAESFVAKKAVECAEEAECNEENIYLKHIGYYLVDDGLCLLKQKINFKESKFLFIKLDNKNKKIRWYLGSIIICTLIVMAAVIILSLFKDEDIRLWKYIVAIIVLVIPCSEIVVSILNWSINSLTEPTFVSKIEFYDEIPKEYSTIVVIPTLLNTEKRVHDLVNDIEVYYLANQVKNIYFAILGDFKDSDVEHEENDDKVIKAALSDIRALNEKYKKDCEEDIFYFLSRYRKYNSKENKWMGWERKRGKLMEFNSLLRAGNNTSYDVVSGDISKLSKIKYVITLDADTQLPRDSAKKLIGAMAHILNIPHIDRSQKKVVRGYGIMQPRVSISTVSANKTLFSKIFSGETGIDIYSTAVSDVYQDVFREGIFTGKGIYDVDVFDFMLKDEIPDNSVLSHDLLEGCYSRTALVTDVELIDGYPTYYKASSMRLHRWVRGDWQLLPWILKKKNAINKLSKWKMIDNLRRSLLSPSIIILIFLSMIVLPNGVDKWLTIASLAIIIPLLFDVSDEVVSPIRGISLSGRIDNGRIVFEQVFLIFCFLPYQAYLMLDAILTTLYRVYISKNKLLRWVTSADVELMTGKDFPSYIRGMWTGSAISLIIIIFAYNKALATGLILTPSCILWFLSPYIAYYISKPRIKGCLEFSEEQLNLLRKLSRKTWAYFEDMVTNETNWLSPDNYQEEPDNGIAYRTSPTNMGMGLMSSIVAYDMGFIGIIEVIERTQHILNNMEDLSRFKGHFYNWYDIRTKEPLKPEYISTVDSGNLVGYMWVVSQALKNFIDQPVISEKQREGLSTILSLGNEEIKKLGGPDDFYKDKMIQLKNVTLDIMHWKMVLLDLWSSVMGIDKLKLNGELYWNIKIKHTISKFIKEIQKLFPWTDIVIERSDRMADVAEKLKDITTKVPMKNLCMEINNIINVLDNISNKDVEEDDWVQELKLLLFSSKREITNKLIELENLQKILDSLAQEEDFSILYDKKRQLFSIGFDIEKDAIGNCYYDLLASEARQASFVAIAKGDIEQKHWFKLGRAMAVIGRTKGLVSWSGTMFEYLMPLLIMKNYPDTLLNETYEAVVDGQKRYCSDRRIPWGISESAFYSFDMNLNYQYKAFGVPGIGLKRGLLNELVISPYSTVMALQIDPQSAYNNINRLISEGMEGKYGFYEAIDYTKERIAKGKKKAIIKCFMVHHEGMSLMALDNVINANILQERFHSVPKVKATELLLQEKVPKRVIYDREQQFEIVDMYAEKQNVIVRSFNTPKTEMPETHLMSNGSYSMMISNSGSGYSKKDDMLIYRWGEDVTQDSNGMFFYMKDINNHKFWSSGYEPCKNEGENYKVVFSLDRAEFSRKDGDILTHTEISISNEDNAEVRRISLTNHGNKTKILEVTSYCEVTLSTLSADIVHPAFSNLFISTEFVESPLCIIADRRPRSKDHKRCFAMQTVAVEGETIGTVQYETSRINFIGRGKSTFNPAAMENDVPLKNSTGAVLDPIISIRERIRIKPGETCRIAYTTAVGTTREEVIELAQKYREMHNVKRVFELSWTQTQVEMKYLGIKSSQANLYQLMASKILFLNTQLKDRSDYIKNIKKGQSSLWAYGISGDVPIVLLIIKKDTDIDFVRQMLNAHEYWSIKGLKVDLVVLNDQNISYVQFLQNSARDIISSSHARDKQGKQGGVFLLSSCSMPKEDVDLIKAAARLVIDSEKGLIITQIKNSSKVIEEVKDLEVKKIQYISKPFSFKERKLEFYNEIGGFDTESNEYVIKLKERRETPAPWINVISNGNFGFHVSESGSAYTWCKNSRENKVTPWSNDWICDTPGEALYLRDEQDGSVWSITSKPIRDASEYIISHGFGYSIFQHEAYGIIGTLTMFAAINSNTKVYILKLANNTDIERRLSITYYAQLVMGVFPQNTSQYISTYIDEENKFIYGKNPYSEHFGGLNSFLSLVGGDDATFTGNRKEFIGRGRNIRNPLAMEKINLSNSQGAGFDPCLAENVKISLKAGEEKSVIVIFGEEDSLDKIRENIERFAGEEKAVYELENVKDYWSTLLGNINVKTPDKTMDILLNGWLLYQTISCRIFARTAFYQSGGAYGFRDQLQDMLSMNYIKPQMTRQQIIYSASRQFLEGDVQHWWHPVVESGIRTRFSDDLLWLPYVTIDYINKTGDYSILEESVSYLQDEPLKEDEDERYSVSSKSDKQGTIYEHCVKAIDRSLKFGEHNIPLMGSGDWNDGMSNVGSKGKGESVWLGWFLYDILDDFVKLCNFKGDIEKEKSYRDVTEFIRESLESNAWDGNWYRRAYFDDGTPLGSIENDECQIDSLSQSWAVLSSAADHDRAVTAMESLWKYLVKDDKGMVLLLTPPFDKSSLEPGYIKSYVPGVRENVGQYTHAVTWAILALVKLGEGHKAWRIFNMINPINHSKSYFESEIYKLEPYVMAADVYAKEPHIGRGGWSWYTGTSGWMYKAGIEGILGLKLIEGKGFKIEPCIPTEWNGFEITYKKDGVQYNVKVERSDSKSILLDGKPIDGNVIPFQSSGEHEVEVNI